MSVLSDVPEELDKSNPSKIANKWTAARLLGVVDRLEARLPKGKPAIQDIDGDILAAIICLQLVLIVSVNRLATFDGGIVRVLANRHGTMDCVMSILSKLCLVYTILVFNARSLAWQHGRTGAAVGYKLEARSHFLLKQNACNMSDVTHSPRTTERYSAAS